MRKLLQRDAAGEVTLLSLILLIAHLQDLNAENDTLDKVDDTDDTEGDIVQNNTQDTGLDVTLHEARNTDVVEDDAHNTEQNLVIHKKSPFQIDTFIIQKTAKIVNRDAENT